MRKPKWLTPEEREEVIDKLKKLTPREIYDLLFDMWLRESEDFYWYSEFQKKRAYQVWVELNQVYN